MSSSRSSPGTTWTPWCASASHSATPARSGSSRTAALSPLMAPRGGSPPISPSGLLEQFLGLTELGMARVAQPLEDHHLRGHDLRAVLPGAFDPGHAVGRITRADRVPRHNDTAPGTE